MRLISGLGYPARDEKRVNRWRMRRRLAIGQLEIVVDGMVQSTLTGGLVLRQSLLLVIESPFTLSRVGGESGLT
jgi:hypothetical protein